MRPSKTASPLAQGTARLAFVVGSMASLDVATADDTVPVPATTAEPVADPVATPEPAAPEEEAPPPAIVLRYVPANHAWDVGLHASYGQRVQFKGESPWLGIGARFGWGKMFGIHRIGFGFAFAAEGEPAIKWSNILTPSFQWDMVTEKGFLFGANAGPATLIDVELSGGFGYNTRVHAAPEMALHIGWSQRFSLIAKRFYVAFEPKVRIIDGQPGFVGAIVLGSGKGY